MPVLARGYDCSYDPPDQQCMKNAGYTFLGRYASRNPDKNLTHAELDSALSKGMSVVLIWQEGKTQMLRGYSGGQTDARDADDFANGLGLRGIPIYFACDQDFEACPGYDKTSIDEYCKGALSIVGKARMGGYGDDTFCKRQFDAGRLTYGMQTYAWSEGAWESRCQLRQVQNNVNVCGGLIDKQEAWASDFGQWPRPSGAAGGGGTSPALCEASVAFDGSGRPWRAGVWANGKVNILAPGAQKWYAVDATQTGAKGGVGLAILGQRILAVYLNADGEFCTYESTVDQAIAPVPWRWSKQGGDFVS